MSISRELCRSWHLVDIGINLTDGMFRGRYNGKEKHECDVEDVLNRCNAVGVKSLLLTGGNVRESEGCLRLCKLYQNNVVACRSTVGCHPTHCDEFLKHPDEYISQLDTMISKNSVYNGGVVAAVGEIGLDFDRLQFCTKEVQEKYFEAQLHLAVKHKLPLFLHDRNSSGRFFDILAPFIHDLHGGVVHSFTGTEQELSAYLQLGLYIGINGCSLKTEENLRVAKLIPLDRLLIETDGPWCEVKNTHASRRLLNETYAASVPSDLVLSQFPQVKKEKFTKGAIVKGRCEPCHLLTVLEVLFLLHRESVASIEELANKLFENTITLFPCFKR